MTVSGSTLYGTTYYGGAYDDGTVFSISTSGGALKTLVSFNGADGLHPLSRLMLIGSTLYGTTYGGARHGRRHGFQPRDHRW